MQDQEEQLSFGSWLRERRKARGLTQRELAERVFCAPVTIKKIEADERRPSRQIVERLLAVLALPADDVSRMVRLARRVPGAAPADAVIGAADRTQAAWRVDQTTVAALPAGEAQPFDLHGHTVRGYRMGALLGSGGFGMVYAAEQTSVGRSVAVKVIRPELADHPAFIRRFETEARLVARLEHPHIVPLYDYWREPGRAYLVMRHLRGGSLRDRLEAGPLPREQAATIIAQIGAALAAAHQAGVIHRDLKPANVLLDPAGNAYLADFGIARGPDDDLNEDRDLIVGSPDYLAPEQLTGGGVSSRTDIYTLGLLIYEVLSGTRPFAAFSGTALIDRRIAGPPPPITQLRPDLPPGLDALLAHAGAPDPAARIADVGAFVTALHQSLTAEPAAILTPERNPYKGLRAFSEADAADFFGRDALIHELLDRLAGSDSADPEASVEPPPLIVVVGPSGSGKSSFVRAGVLPALRRGALPGSERWFIAELTPGADPAAALLEALRHVSVDPLHDLPAAPQMLATATQRICGDDPDAQLVLVIDQFEELFTLTMHQPARDAFIADLVTALTDPQVPVRVIITLRADFFDRPLAYPTLGDLFRRGTMPLAAMAPADIQAAILEPAARAGVAVEPELAAALVSDVRQRVGALPLLQYTLTELYEHEGGKLTLAGYQALGGMAGALAQRAEAIVGRLDPAGLALARRCLLRLVTPGDNDEATRRRALRAELEDIAGPQERATLTLLLEQLGRYRLISFDRDPASRAPTVELAHEALITAWKRLDDWVATARERLRLRRRVLQASAEWAAAGRDPAFLPEDAALSRLAPLLEPDAATEGVALSEAEWAYLQAGLAAQAERRDRERRQLAAEAASRAQARVATRLRRLAVGLAVAIVVVIGLAGLAWGQRSSALQSEAETRRLALAGAALADLEQRPDQALALARAALGRDTPDAAPPLVRQALYTSFNEAGLRAVLPGHAGSLRVVAWSPDGARLLTGGDDGMVRLWQSADNSPVAALQRPIDAIRAAAWSPDGTRILTAGADGLIRIWDADLQTVLLRWPAATTPIGAAAWDPTGTRIVGAAYDGTATIWQADTGSALQALRGHSGALRVAVWSPDGARILTAGDEGTARVWNVADGTVERVLRGHTGVISSAAWSPDGTQIVTGGSDLTIRVWDAADGAERLRLDSGGSWVWSVDWSPDGAAFASGGFDGVMRIWDAVNGTELRQLRAGGARIWDVAWSPDGTELVAATEAGAAQRWDLAAGRATYRLPPGPRAGTVKWHTDGRLAAVGAPDGVIQVWERPTGAAEAPFASLTPAAASAVFHLSWAPGRERLLAAYADGTARIWDVAAATMLHEMQAGPEPLLGDAWAPDGRRVLGITRDGRLLLWELDRDTWRDVGVRTADRFSAAAWHPDGAAIVVGDQAGRVTLYDATNLAEQRVFTGLTAQVRVLSWNAAGTLLAGAGDDGSIRIWNNAGTTLATMNGHAGAVISLAWSPDGTRLLSGGNDGIVRLWSAAGVELRALGGHGRTITAIHWLDDGSGALVGVDPGVERIWLLDDALIMADVTRRVCAVGAEPALAAALADWRGCAQELAALSEALARADQWRMTYRRVEL